MYGIHIPDKVRFMSITDKVRYIRITDKVRYTRNTDFVYNGQKTLVPTGTLYARFTVVIIIVISQSVIWVVYHHDNVIHKFVMKITDLPFLPTHHIHLMFVRIESLVLPNRKMCKLIKYVCQPSSVYSTFEQCTTSLN